MNIQPYKSTLQELKDLDQKRRSLKRKIKAEAARQASPPSPPLWQVLRDHLEAQRGQYTPVAEVVEAMVEAGHALGKYPKRTVKQSLISPHMSGVFQVELRHGIEMVRLRPAAFTVHYATQGERSQQAKRSSIAA